MFEMIKMSPQYLSVLAQFVALIVFVDGSMLVSSPHSCFCSVDAAHKTLH